MTTKRKAIRVGDGFQSNNELWTVTEAMPFGRGYWVINKDRCRQTVFNRATLESMERAQGIQLHI